MRISDGSSDVCSSDLAGLLRGVRDRTGAAAGFIRPATPPLPRAWPYAPTASRVCIRIHDLRALQRAPARPSRYAHQSNGLTRGTSPRALPVTSTHKRSEEQKSEIQSLMRNSDASFCLK